MTIFIEILDWNCNFVFCYFKSYKVWLLIWFTNIWYYPHRIRSFNVLVKLIDIAYPIRPSHGLRPVSILFSSLIQSTLLSSELATTSSTLSPARSALYTKYYLYSNASTDAILLQSTCCEAPLACDWNTTTFWWRK